MSGCPNASPEFNFGSLDDPMIDLINNLKRLNNIVCEVARNPKCWECEVFKYCGGDCHQLGWQGRCMCAPKSLMKQLAQMKSEGDMVNLTDPINAQNIVDRFKEVVTDVADKDIVWEQIIYTGHSSFSASDFGGVVDGMQLNLVNATGSYSTGETVTGSISGGIVVRC